MKNLSLLTALTSLDISEVQKHIDSVQSILMGTHTSIDKFTNVPALTPAP